VEYARKILNEECRIDWSRPAKAVLHHIHGLSPFPGAFTFADFGKGPERLKILRGSLCEGSGPPGALLDDSLTVACGEGVVQILDLQRAGSKPMSAVEFLRGVPLARGKVLG
jgi:methionyl-tRNA formyltransferase